MQYTARIWIRGPGGVSVSITDARATEGDDRIRFTVTLSAPPVETVTVEYATRDLDAMAGNDYTAKSGTLTFDPPRVSQGKPRAVIEVPVRDDTVIEDREKFAVVLTNPSSGLAVSDGTANGTIDDNDQGAEFDLTSPRTNGGNFDVRLDFRLPVFDVDIADFKANVHLSAGLIVDINQYTGGQRFILTIDSARRATHRDSVAARRRIGRSHNSGGGARVAPRASQLRDRRRGGYRRNRQRVAVRCKSQRDGARTGLGPV